MINIIASIIAAVGAIIAGLLMADKIRPGRLAKIKKYADLYLLLPNEFSSKDELGNFINIEISNYIKFISENKRDPTGIALGIFLLLVAIACFWLIFQFKGWWYVGLPIPIIVFILGGFGLQRDSRRVKRDNNGNPI